MIKIKSPSSKRFQVMGLLETYEGEAQKHNRYKQISFYKNPSLKETSPIIQKLYQVLEHCDKHEIDANEFILAQFAEWERLTKHYPTYPTVQYIGANPGCKERYAIWDAKRGHPGVEVETTARIFKRKLENLLARRTNLTEDSIFDNPILMLWFPVDEIKKHPSFIERRDRNFYDGWARIVLKHLLDA